MRSWTISQKAQRNRDRWIDDLVVFIGIILIYFARNINYHRFYFSDAIVTFNIDRRLSHCNQGVRFKEKTFSRLRSRSANFGDMGIFCKRASRKLKFINTNFNVINKKFNLLPQTLLPNFTSLLKTVQQLCRQRFNFF